MLFMIYTYWISCLRMPVVGRALLLFNLFMCNLVFMLFRVLLVILVCDRCAVSVSLFTSLSPSLPFSSFIPPLLSPSLPLFCSLPSSLSKTFEERAWIRNYKRRRIRSDEDHQCFVLKQNCWSFLAWFKAKQNFLQILCVYVLFPRVWNRL